MKMRRSPVQRPGRVGRYLRFEIRSVVLFTSLILVVEIVGIFSCTGGRSGAPRATRPSYRDAGARGGDAPGDRYGPPVSSMDGGVFSLAGLLLRGRRCPASRQGSCRLPASAWGRLWRRTSHSPDGNANAVFLTSCPREASLPSPGDPVEAERRRARGDGERPFGRTPDVLD